jgi:hypothetical protein
MRLVLFIIDLGVPGGNDQHGFLTQQERHRFGYPFRLATYRDSRFLDGST